jgi:hypothetical protein
VLGLASRRFSAQLPFVIAEYGGDVLYASCMFSIIRFIAIELNLLKVSFISFLLCALIEILQLYQADWIQKVRQTPPFGLVLGYGFLWSDFLCYAVGVVFGLVICSQLERNNSTQVL